MAEVIDIQALGRALVSEPPAEQMPVEGAPGGYDERAPNYADLVDAIDCDFDAVAAGSKVSFLRFGVRREARAADGRLTAARFSGHMVLARAWAPHVDNWRASLTEG